MRPAVKIYQTIDQVPASAWNRLIKGDNVFLHTEHLKAVERSKINGIKPFYLSITNGRLNGIAYFFSMQMDFSKLNKRISPKVGKILKHWFPNFMNMNMLECGLISGLGETISVEDGGLSTCLPTIVHEMEAKAAEMRSDIILIRDIPYEKLNAYKNVLIEKQFVPVLGFPTTRLELNWDSLDAYFHALKSHSQNDLHQHLPRLDAPEISVETIGNFKAYADHLERLWENVHNRSTEYEHEKLTAKYFYEISNCFSDRSFIVAIKRNGEIIAYSLCLEGSDTLYALYTGLDFEYNNQYHLYFNTYFLDMQEAIRRKKKFIDFGITSYDFKLLIGCELKPLVYFIKHVHNQELTKALVKMWKDSVEQPENIHHPFQNQDISERIQLSSLQKELDESLVENRYDIFNQASSYTRTDIGRLSGLYAFFPAFESVQEPRVQYHGKSVIMLGSNSYMGLASHPEIVEAAREIMDIYGTGCSGSPFLNGTLDIHMKLARSLAEFMRKEDALLFSTGYQTNLGVIGALGGRHSVLIMDSLNHASLVDAARFSLAEVERYRHNDMNDLERLLKKYERKEKLVISDSVFSMEGTMANIPEIVRLCRQYGARLMLDEAHGIGVLGPGGRGAAEYFGMLDQVDIVMGTFSKSFAAVGGFVAGNAKVIEYLRLNSRSHMFSASLPPVIVAIVQKALEIIIREPERRRNLLKNAEYLALKLSELGYQALFRGTAIVPVHVGDETLTLGLFNKLFREGVYVHPVLTPAVPKGQECLRTSTMATHTEEQLNEAAEIFKKVRTPYFPQTI
jgi:8-amino-7-oxononanoate synthase